MNIFQRDKISTKLIEAVWLKAYNQMHFNNVWMPIFLNVSRIHNDQRFNFKRNT